MSYSKYERGKYIQSKIIDLLLHDLLMTPEQFGVVWDLMDKMDTAGTTHCAELANNEYYKKAVAAWVEAKRINRQRFMKSKSK